jgi:hypothetical protein
MALADNQQSITLLVVLAFDRYSFSPCRRRAVDFSVGIYIPSCILITNVFSPVLISSPP